MEATPMDEISSLCTYAFKEPGKIVSEEQDTLVHTNIIWVEQEEKVQVIL